MSDLKGKYEVFTRETIGIQKDKVIVDSPILHIYHSEFAQRPRVTDWETVNSILRLVFDPTPHVIGDTQNAIRACLQLLNYRDALYKKIDPKWENKDPSFQERTPQEMFIPLRKKRISGISKMYTNELHDNLKGIFSENFDLRELPPRTCLIHPVGDLQPLCNYPNVKEIFETFDFKITPKYFFDCLFTDDELITLYNNVILLKKGNFFESKETWTEKEKFKYMQNLCYIKTGLLSYVYNKYEINPENIEELSVYLGSLETRKEINTDRLNQMLKKRTTRLRVARPYHYHAREDTPVLPKKDENADK